MPAGTQPNVHVPSGQGVAFDINMLTRPTQRRLMTLWTELSGQRTALLPQVFAELTATPEFEAPKTLPSARAQREAWAAIVRAPQSPFEKVLLDKDARERVGEIILQFTLPCFPLLNNVDEITTHSDAIVLAQGLAAGMDVIVSNNMRSVDHIEINGLVREVFGRNAGLLLVADDALLAAHACGEGSRALLVMALASAWPDDCRELNTGEAERRLASLCERLDGATMPQTAIRLRNRFATDGDLDSVLQEARNASTASNALFHERTRAEWARRRRVDASMLRREAGVPPSPAAGVPSA